MWGAREIALDRTVVIKFLPPDIAVEASAANPRSSCRGRRGRGVALARGVAALERNRGGTIAPGHNRADDAGRNARAFVPRSPLADAFMRSVDMMDRPPRRGDGAAR